MLPKNPAPITATGLKGFCLWLKREQPAIYDSVAPKLPQMIPKAFGNYFQMQKRAYPSRGQRSKSTRSKSQGFSTLTQSGLGKLGDYYGGAPVGIYYGGNPVLSTTSTDLNTIDPAFNSDFSPVAIAAPVANAATMSTSSTSTIGTVAQVIGTAANVALSAQNAATFQAAVNSQLARARAGLPPLNTTMNQLGVPVAASSGTSPGTLMLLAVAALAAIVLVSD